jgi:hypothetical protein
MSHREVEDDLGRIEGIDPARPPFVLLENPVEAPGQRQHPVAHDGDGNRVDQIAVEQVEIGALAPISGRMYSLENFGSAAQRKKNSSKAFMLKVAAGIPRTMVAGLSAAVRTVLTWQAAQLTKTRSMPW